MIRYVFALLLIVVSGFFMFKVKYRVQELEDELGRVRQANRRRAAGNPRPRMPNGLT